MAVKTDYSCDLCGEERSAFADLVMCSKCEYWFCSYCISWVGEGAPWCPNCEASWYGDSLAYNLESTWYGDSYKFQYNCSTCGHPYLFDYIFDEHEFVLSCPRDYADAPNLIVVSE